MAKESTGAQMDSPAKSATKNGVQAPYPGKTASSGYAGGPGASMDSPAKPGGHIGNAASVPIKVYPGSAAETKGGKPGASIEGPCSGK